MIWIDTKTDFGLTRNRVEFCRKFQKGIYSETIRTFRFIPIFVSKPMRIIVNQSEKRFVPRLMTKGQESIRINLSKPSFQFKSI